jgi:hypothetical protein
MTTRRAWPLLELELRSHRCRCGRRRVDDEHRLRPDRHLIEIEVELQNMAEPTS